MHYILLNGILHMKNAQFNTKEKENHPTEYAKKRRRFLLLKYTVQ